MTQGAPIARAAILGAGYISDFHAKAIAKEPGVDLVAICDLNEPAAKRLGQLVPDARIYTDYAAMLAEAKPDVVHVLTQPDSHFVLSKMALEAGAHVLAEKPVTTSVDEAHALAALAAEHDRRIAVNHNFVFSRPFNQLHAMLEGGELGPLKSVRIAWKKSLAQATFGPWNLWMLREPGNILFEIGSHTFSELLSIVDGPEVTRVVPTRAKKLPSGSSFYRRWDLGFRAGDVAIDVEIFFDEGYAQHFVEVEGLFGVARADIENDVFVVDQPTGRAYDLERFAVNVRGGLERAKQAARTYGSYGASKFVKSATGAPYESSMLVGIQNGYALLRGEPARRESTMAYAVDVTATSEAVRAKMPAPPAELLAAEAPPVPSAVREAQRDCRVLIVGASGFIGKRLLLALQDDPRGVRGLVRNPSALVGTPLSEHVEILQGDFRDEATMEKALRGVEVVFHLAVAHGKSLEGYLRLDSEPTLRFARQCQRRGVKRFVYTGTIDSLDLSKARRLKESDGVDPKLSRRNNYAHSKAITEQKLMQLHESEGFPLVIARPAIVLGAGGPVTHVGVANWSGIGRLAYWGEGDNLLPIVLVEDIADALVAASTAPGIEGRIYNLSADSVISARDYVAEVERVLGARIQTETSKARQSVVGDLVKWGVKVLARHPDRARVPSVHDWKCREQHASFDITAARQDLGWDPTSDRETILERGVRAPARLFLES